MIPRTPGRAGLLVGLALVAATNGWILARVAWNRSGEPEARVELTERELGLPWRPPDEDEESGLSLILHVQGPARWDRDPNPPWLDRDKLRELGFDVHVPLASAEAADFYAEVPRRKAYAVFEMEGDAWRRHLEDKEEELAHCRARLGCPEGTTAKELEGWLESLRQTGSRLIAIDAGRNPEALRRRHPDRRRCLILPVLVGLVFESASQGSPAALNGYLDPQNARIHVPLPLRSTFDAVYRDQRRRGFRGPDESGEAGEQDPRYRAVLGVGDRYEPWLAGAERISAGPSASFEKPQSPERNRRVPDP
jgi:Domain of unknown function (DUF4824)